MLPHSIQNLIEEFSRLPGIGPKTAARLTFYLLSKSDSDIKKLGGAVSALKEGLVFCEICYNISEKSPCVICDDLKRDKTKVLVVEEPLDIIALERTDYDGQYHVLGGVISPIDGIGPENLRIRQLLDRLNNGGINEIILATDPSLEGEATAMYITKQISNLKTPLRGGRQTSNLKDLKVTRIARGLPVGGDLEYADEVTLKNALEGRREI